jgi:hypothetical protein
MEAQVVAGDGTRPCSRFGCHAAVPVSSSFVRRTDRGLSGSACRWFVRWFAQGSHSGWKVARAYSSDG